MKKKSIKQFLAALGHFALDLVYVKQAVTAISPSAVAIATSQAFTIKCSTQHAEAVNRTIVNNSAGILKVQTHVFLAVRDIQHVLFIRL